MLPDLQNIMDDFICALQKKLLLQGVYIPELQRMHPIVRTALLPVSATTPGPKLCLDAALQAACTSSSTLCASTPTCSATSRTRPSR